MRISAKASMNGKQILLAAIITGAALAGQSPQLRTDINPALLYYQGFLTAPDPMANVDSDYLNSKKAREQKWPEKFGTILAGYDHEFEFVRQAAHAKVPCDWGVDLSRGPETMLPHLGRAKFACQVGQWRTIWALQNGRQENARDELVAAFVLGRNAGSGDLFISALIQGIVEGMCCTTIAAHFGEFTPETFQQIVEGFDAAPARHSMAACVKSERELGDWVLKKVLELQKTFPSDNAKFMTGLHDSGLVTALSTIGYTNFWPRLVAASGGTSDGVLKLLRETEPLWPRISEIMTAPQPEYDAKVKQFTVDTGNSQNPFFTLFYALFNGWDLGTTHFKLRQREFRAETQVAMVHAAAAYKLRGEPALKSVTDPFGNGPFAYKRFEFKGKDRGFELKSAYTGADAPFVMIFVEKQGPAFEVFGAEAGKALTQ
ncbi:MAG TPA: hypothetical protein VLT36_07940 [Candidatus Dormibacteraeota bacterium]|nr:hypothetical protein [Candidatus Dormibacteraeota bacterium]